MTAVISHILVGYKMKVRPLQRDMVYVGSSEVNLKNNLLTVNMFVMYRGVKVVSFCPGFARLSCHSCKVQLLYSENVCKCPYFPELYAIIIFLVVNSSFARMVVFTP